MVNDKGDIENTTWREEFERLLRSILPESPGGIAMTRDGAIFVDEIAKAAYKVARSFQKQHGKLEAIYANVFKYLIDETMVHELGHILDGLTEEQTKAATRKLLHVGFEKETPGSPEGQLLHSRKLPGDLESALEPAEFV